ncbi:tripartite tricarboxylate transporter permease, partial [Streptococcus pneumoniae]
IMISIVGIDMQTGTERYTFGSIQLLDGIDFLVVALGIFALAEVFYMLLRGGGGKEVPRNAIGSLKLSGSEVKQIAGP